MTDQAEVAKLAEPVRRVRTAMAAEPPRLTGKRAYVAENERVSR